jgi:hypothetical protein
MDVSPTIVTGIKEALVRKRKREFLKGRSKQIAQKITDILQEFI